MRRIVVTGMGAVSPLGCGVETNWSVCTENLNTGVVVMKSAKDGA
jgi:3-oxoacyl-(acyl-carrier-protein) synthase